jgi:tetratricopeptide (TPR) repeat protein
MRFIRAAAGVMALSACSTVKPPAVTPAPPSPAARLAAADALVRAGCFDCLLAAFREYDALRQGPRADEAATASAVRTAALLAVRERELGTEDSGYLERARELAVGRPSIEQAMAPLLEIADTLPTRGGARQVSDDIELNRMQAANRNRAAWTEHLRAHADDDALSAYLWMGFNCSYVPTSQHATAEWLGQLPAWSDAPLIAFKTATCGTFNRAAIDRLLQADPRFVELNYFAGLSATFTGRLDDASDHLQRAYAWRPRWPAVTNSLANIAITLEDFDQAVEFFDRTLEVMPAFPDALLGKVRALTHSGRHEEALVTVDQLLALGRWLIGDARYWRALNEAQLARNDEAWEDVELAARLLVNAEVPKLAGIIAYRRKQLDVAIAKFDESRTRNREDCETGFYLGVVLAEQAVWVRTADVLVETGRCLDTAEQVLTDEIERIRGADDPPARRERQIARREQQIAAGRRMMATSWFNVAVACYNLGRKPEARLFAERVVEDAQFGERARDLLTRLK